MSPPPIADQSPEHAPATVPRAALETALRELDRAAALLRRQLQGARDQDRRAAGLEAHFKALRLSGEAALALERDGIEPVTAALRIALARGFPAATVRHWQEAARRAKAPEDRARRNRELVRLAALGHTNGELARRFGLCPKTIGRILKDAMRARR